MTLPPGGTDILQRRERQLDLLRQDHQEVVDHDLRASEHLDRIVLVGGATALIASASHAQSLPGPLGTGSVVALGLGWTFLLAAGACGIVAHLCARQTAKRLHEMYTRKIAEGDPLPSKSDWLPAQWWIRHTQLLNVVGLACFAAGVAAVLAFAWINLPRS